MSRLAVCVALCLAGCRFGYSQESRDAMPSLQDGAPTLSVFVTAATTAGDIGGIGAADALCNIEGDRPSISVSYKAMLVDGSNRVASLSADAGDGQVDWVFQPATTYHRADGLTPVMTTDANGLFVFGALANSFGTGTNFYWTGMGTDWTPTGGNCLGWSVTTGNGGRADQTKIDADAIWKDSKPCSTSFALLCVEQ